MEFNHIDHCRNTIRDIEQLKAWYLHYHRLMKLYEWSYRSVHRRRIVLDNGSLGVRATMNVMSVEAVSGAALLVNGFTKTIICKTRRGPTRMRT